MGLMTLTLSEKFSKIKYRLYRDHPFFSYIIGHMKMIEEKGETPTLGVTGRGEFYYNKGFVEQTATKYLITYWAHEAMHVAFQHPKRMKGRSIVLTSPIPWHAAENRELSADEMKAFLPEEGRFMTPQEMKRNSFSAAEITNAKNFTVREQPISLWNVATDIVINNILVKSGAEFEDKKGLVPEDDKITLFGKCEVVDISKKSAEEIYEELKAYVQQNCKQQSGKGQKQKGYKVSGLSEQSDHSLWGKGEEEGKGKGEGDGDEEGDGNGQPTTGTSKQQQEKDWGKVLAEAHNFAKMRGKEPLGMEREYEASGKSKIKYRHVLSKLIAKSIPSDYTWSRPSRKLISQGIYVPATTGEEIRIIISIDTSGSMSAKELGVCVSELLAISRSFDHVEFRLLTHDHEVQNDWKISNGDINKIKKLQMKGGGGTSHRPVYEYIKKKGYMRNAKLLVSYTDGYSDFPEKPCVDTLFILVGSHVAPKDMPRWGKVLTAD